MSVNSHQLSSMAKYVITRGVDFDEAYVDFCESDTLHILQQKRYTVSETGVSSRVINHWSGLGLLHDSNKKEGKWRKLSITEAIWVRIIEELRLFNVSLDQVKSVRQWLFYTSIDGRIRTRYFDYFNNLAFLGNSVFIVVFADGFAQFCLENEYREFQKIRGNYPSHILLNLNEIIQSIYPNLNLKTIVPKFEAVSKQELSLLKEIRSGSFDAIRVRFNDGQPVLIELEKTENIEKKLFDIIQEDKYQKIELLEINGGIKRIKRTIQKKLDDSL